MSGGTVSGPNAGAGWYPDQGNNEQERFWDGSQWTNEFRTVVAPPTQEAPRSVAPSGGRRRAFFIAAVSVALAAVCFEMLAELFFVIGLPKLDTEVRFQVGEWIRLLAFFMQIAVFGVALAAFLAKSIRTDLLRVAAILSAITFSVLAVACLYDIVNNIVYEATDGNQIVVDSFKLIASFAGIAASLFALKGIDELRSGAISGFQGNSFFLSALFLAISYGGLAAGQIATTIGDSNDGLVGGIITGDVFIVVAYLGIAAAWVVAATAFKKPTTKARDVLLASGGIPFATGYFVAAIGAIILIDEVGSYYPGIIKGALWMQVISGLVWCAAGGLVSAAFFSARRSST